MTRSFTNFTRRLFLTLVAVFMAVTSLSFGTVVRAEDSDLLKSDKDTYVLGDPIMVTAKGSGKDWVGLYKKGETYDPNNGGTKSFYWYYVAEVDETVDITQQRPNIEREKEYVAGEYKLVLFENDSYNAIATKEIVIEEPVTLATDKEKYTINEPIVVTATGGKWVAVYKKGEVPADKQGGYFYAFDVDGESHNIYNEEYKGERGTTYYGSIPQIDLTVFLFGDEGYDNVLKEVNIHINGSTNTSTLSVQPEYKEGDEVEISASSDIRDAWVGIYEGTFTSEDTFSDKGIESFYLCFAENKGKTIKDLKAGKYTAVLFKSAKYKVDKVVNFEVKEDTEPEPSDDITLDREGYPAIYNYGDPVLVSANSTNPAASIRMCDEDPNDTFGFNNGYYVSVKVSDIEDSVDIVAKAIEAGNTPKAGKIYRVYLIVPTAENTNAIHSQVKFTLEGISLDREGYPAIYNYGDPVLVSAKNANPEASIRMCDKDPNDTFGFNNGYYVSVKVSDIKNSVDIVAKAIEAGNTPEAGKTYRVYLIVPTAENTNAVDSQVKFTLEGEPQPSELLSTDKDTYDFDEPIMVTTNFKEENAWVGLYKKGEPVDGSVKSIFWYYISEEENPVNILSTRDENGRAKDYGAGEFTVVLYAVEGDNWYVVKATKDITVKEPLLSTDKDEYTYGEPIMVTTNFKEENAWVGLYKKGEPFDDSVKSIFWYYISEEENPVNILSTRDENGRAEDYGVGEFTVVLYAVEGDNWYVVKATKDITVKEEEVPVHEISLDREGRPAIYNYGDPVLVSAKSTNPAASIRMCDEDANDTFGFNNGYYVSVKVSDIEDSVDIVAKAIEAGNKPKAGKIYRVYLIEPTADNANDWVNQVKFTLNVVYYDDDAHLVWTLADDKKSATVAFSRTDGVDKPETRTTTALVKEEKTAAKCEETGIDTYTATYEFGADDALLTENGRTSFTHVFEVVTEALGHDWGEWEVVNPATETEEGLERRYCKRDPEHFEERAIPKTSHVHEMEHFEAKAATCEEDGNTEYWHCTGCDKYFSDAEGEHEIDKDSWILKALGHNYGDWQFDEEKCQHYKVCANDETHVIREDCSLVIKSADNGVLKRECEICHGKTEVTVLSTDKKEYKYNEPIMVTALLDEISSLPDFDREHAWIGFYPKGVVPGPNLSIFWYYIDKEGSPFNVLDGVCDANGLLWQYKPGGEYSIFLCQNEGYDYVTSVDIKISEEISGDISLELNGIKQENAQQSSFVETDLSVKFKAAVDDDCGSAWIGLYKEKVSADMDFKSYKSAKSWNLYDVVDQEIDITSEVSTPGWYTMVVFGDGGYDDKRMYINFEVTKEIVSEEIIKEASCEDYGSKTVTYKDGTTETVLIDPLGHDWGEWETVKEATCEEAGEEKRICKRDETHVDTREIKALGHAFGNWKFDEKTHTHTGVCEHDETHTLTEDCTFKEISREGDKVTYECEVCGGKYTAVEADDEIVRIFDETRFGTSIKAAEELKHQMGVDKFNAVVIANGRDFADALAGSYLAYVKGAPILITADMFGGKEVYKEINDYVKANLAEGGTVYVLGGEKAVSPKAIADLSSYTVKRLAGATRYETNILILKEAEASGEDLLVCTAYNYADSLSGSAAKKPILLVAKEGLRDDQKAYLKDAGSKNIYIAGGTAAVSKDIETDLGNYGKVTRLAGSTRYETSVAIAEQFFAKTDSAVFTYAYNFPDGLCGGPVAAVMNAPLILTSDAAAEAAANYADGQEITSAVILGGTKLISDEAVRDILRLDKDVEIKVK